LTVEPKKILDKPCESRRLLHQLPDDVSCQEAHEDGGMSRPPSRTAPRRAQIEKAAVEIDAQTTRRSSAI
jgi:hypothetical protein